MSLTKRIETLEDLAEQSEIAAMCAAIHLLSKPALLELAGPGFSELTDDEIQAVVDGKVKPVVRDYNEIPGWVWRELESKMASA